MSAIVLAGGKSTRLGRDKLAEKVAGRTLLEHVVSRLAPLGQDILVVVAPGQTRPPVPPQVARVVTDLYPGKSALGGVHAGLMASIDQFNIVVAGDMPLLNSTLLARLLELAPGWDAVVPRLGGRVEPLHSIYSLTCLPAIERQLQGGSVRTRDFFENVRARYVEDEEIDRFDPEHLSFFNVNTEQDLARVRELL